MKTQGLQSFQSLQKSSLLDHTQRSDKSANLSGEEQKMISTKFSAKNTSLELYEGSGSTRKEDPSARGSHIDITV